MGRRPGPAGRVPIDSRLAMSMERGSVPPGRPPQGLPAGRQFALLGVLALVALAAFLAAPALGRLTAPRPAPEAPTLPPGTFRPTDEQWAGLGLVQVHAVQLQPHIDTDGKIATDDDLTTQVFSPYSGRVTKIFVEAGAPVRAGQPLFAVQAAELAQGRGDLAAAAAQARLAQANEARLRAVYQSGGGALKDWR